MKNDARFLINQRKRQKNKLRTTNTQGVVDARKILNSKRKSNLIGPRKSGGIRRPASNLRRTIPTKPLLKVPDKKVQVERDGNILITARSKDSPAYDSRRFLSSANASSSKTEARWVPSDIDTADLEHISIDDVLDMDALPSAPIRPSNISAVRPIHRTLAEEILEMQNTMVADQVGTSSSTSASVHISNLHPSVSKHDIIELFGDVGMIKHVEMNHPGKALIEYFEPSDAIKACDLYHNRLLDGQAMQCVLQTQTSHPRSFISQRLGERLQSSSHQSSASSSSSYGSRVMYNPRNVKFTVKLN